MSKTAVTTEFSTLALSQPLTALLAELGYVKLTPVQKRSIPVFLNGNDLIVQAATGSGKTAAFGLPILEKLKLEIQKPQALILCPTRELSEQVAREIKRLGAKHSGLRMLVLSGGQPMGPQKEALELGVHLIVGTPGRVLDHLNRKSLDLSYLRILILDEADRMLEMGFQEDMEKILSKAPDDRQTGFFSATFPRSISEMSEKYQSSPHQISIESEGSAKVQIRQIYYEADQETKPKALIWILGQHNPDSAIVFCNQKLTVDFVKDTLVEAGFSVDALHGDLEQADRDRAMAKFRNKSTRILVATDVAARGIDIQALDLVVNFDLPMKTEIYVHRIGRTGRAGQSGQAVSLATPRDKTRFLGFEKAANTTIAQKTLPALSQLDAEAKKKALGKVAEMETLYISGGKKDKIRAGDILGAFTGEAGGVSGSDIGKIEIHERFSYVAVSKKVSQSLIQKLKLGKIKGRRYRVERIAPGETLEAREARAKIQAKANHAKHKATASFLAKF